MRKVLATIMILVLCCMAAFSVCAFAEEPRSMEFNWDDYTLEELVEIQEGLSAKINEKTRAWAIEHGDRVITLTGEEKPVYTGKTTTLSAVVEKVLETAPDTTKLVWTSSDPAVATVNTAGVVTGVSKGTAVINCHAEDNDAIFAEKEVEIILPVTAVTMPEAKATALIIEGGSENGVQLTASVEPEDAYCQELVWTSSNEAVATVDENGYVSALTPGTAVITATSPDEYSAGSRKASCTVTVLQAVSAIELDSAELVLNMGAYQSVKATVLPENASNKNVTWESSDPTVVTVANGQVKAVGCGEAVVTALAADGSGAKAECPVSVIQMVTAVKIAESANPLVLNKDGEMQLTAVITPDYATNQTVAWSSSDESVVTVSEDGTLFGVNGGNAVITCAATDGSEKYATVNIFIPTIAVEETEINVNTKDGYSFPVRFYGQDGNFDIAVSNSGYFFTADIAGPDEDGEIMVSIDPVRYGKGTLTLLDKADSRNNRTLTVNIGHDAVYDTTSYPTGNYTAIMRDPYRYDGEQMSIYGRVLQKQSTSGYGMSAHNGENAENYTLKPLAGGTVSIGGSAYGSYGHSVVMRVATSGRWDDVFYVTCSKYEAEGIIEDDYITVYGTCRGTRTYTTVLGGSVTIPELDAEKIIFGRG